MERLRLFFLMVCSQKYLANPWKSGGYEILGDILRSKAQLINLTAFEILFEFFGVNFNSPEFVSSFKLLIPP